MYCILSINKVERSECGCPLTCSNDSLNGDAWSFNLLGKFMDSLIGIFIGVRINVGSYPWQFNCKDTRTLMEQRGSVYSCTNFVNTLVWLNFLTSERSWVARTGFLFTYDSYAHSYFTFINVYMLACLYNQLSRYCSDRDSDAYWEHFDDWRRKKNIVASFLIWSIGSFLDIAIDS